MVLLNVSQPLFCVPRLLCVTQLLCVLHLLCVPQMLFTTAPRTFIKRSSNIHQALLERNQIFLLQVVCIIIIQNLKYFAAILFVGAPQTQKSLGTLHWLAICIESIMQLLKGRWLSKPLE